jgi:Zn-dependent metalloprotease
MTRMLSTSILFMLAACTAGNSVTSDDSDVKSLATVQQISLDYLHALPEYEQFKQSSLELKLISSQQDQYGMTHLRYRQEFKSVPLLDAEIITHIRDQSVYRLDGQLASVGLTSARPSIDVEQAVALAIKSKNIRPPFTTRESLVVASTTNPYDRLAWLITLNKALKRYIFLIDANTATIIREIPGIDTSTID